MTAMQRVILLALQAAAEPMSALAVAKAINAEDQRNTVAYTLKSLVADNQVKRHHSPTGILTYSVTNVGAEVQALAAPRKEPPPKPPMDVPAGGGSEGADRTTENGRAGRAAILEVLKSSDRPMRVSEIASASAVTERQAHYLLRKLFHDGFLDKPQVIRGGAVTWQLRGRALPATATPAPNASSQWTPKILGVLQDAERPLSRPEILALLPAGNSVHGLKSALLRLRNEGLLEMIGTKCRARWRVTFGAPAADATPRVASPEPPASPEPSAATVDAVPAAEAATPETASPAPSEPVATPPAARGSTVPEDLPATHAGEVAVPTSARRFLEHADGPLHAQLLARIGGIAADIDDLTGEAIDAGLGAGALKSLVAAAGCLRRALMPFNLRQ